jgi:hypothetical protein
MMQRLLILVCGVWLCAAPSIAQTAKPKPVQLTGTWVGELVPQGDTGVSITLKLTVDSKNVVSGTFEGMPKTGDVKPGSTFDPKTGALKLQLGITGESAARLVFEGTIAKNKIAGKMSGERTGTFTLTKKS